MGGGKVTPITLFDDNGYSNQSEADEEDEDDDVNKNRRSSESSVYLGKEASSQSRFSPRIDIFFDAIRGSCALTALPLLYQGCIRVSSTSSPL